MRACASNFIKNAGAAPGMKKLCKISMKLYSSLSTDFLDEARKSGYKLRVHFARKGTIMHKRVMLLPLWTILIILCGGPAVAGQMIQSDRNSGLAINAWNGAQHGTELRLHNGCQKNNPDCTWHWNNGMIVSDRDPGLAINAWNGAQHGTVLRLHNSCQPNNPDCTWDWGLLSR